jgi:hypothetical protein
MSSSAGAADSASALQPGRYRHYKGGEYQVHGVATHSESGELLVVYRPLYGAGGLWVRPLSMFLEAVEFEGKLRPRFSCIEPAD